MAAHTYALGGFTDPTYQANQGDDGNIYQGREDDQGQNGDGEREAC